MRVLLKFNVHTRLINIVYSLYNQRIPQRIDYTV